MPAPTLSSLDKPLYFIGAIRIGLLGVVVLREVIFLGLLDTTIILETASP